MNELCHICAKPFRRPEDVALSVAISAHLAIPPELEPLAHMSIATCTVCGGRLTAGIALLIKKLQRLAENDLVTA